ncbi:MULTISPECIES: phage tail protein [Actinosynnema]|uniref:phage tail protein n=1 Tax=Actinosynnema TaxID=40566 RepID=UPI0020A3F538|nr:phage tail protein [Actinosynnema pretiosum]MCP2098351.1 phage tail protein domain-containing protein [Actinosynnema pretiosum]
MRLGTLTLPSPHPLGERLPAVYTEDGFTQRFTEALDEVLTPVFTALDGFAAYLDPRTAPEDFLDLLAHWVALDVGEGWTPAQRRELIASAVRLHRWRGTRRGLAEHVRLLSGGEVEVVDSGACTSTDQPGQPLPETGPPSVRVVVRVADPESVDRTRLASAVAGAVPAHVAVEVEVVGQ